MLHVDIAYVARDNMASFGGSVFDNTEVSDQRLCDDQNVFVLFGIGKVDKPVATTDDDPTRGVERPHHIGDLNSVLIPPCVSNISIDG